MRRLSTIAVVCLVAASGVSLPGERAAYAQPPATESEAEPEESESESESASEAEDAPHGGIGATELPPEMRGRQIVDDTEPATFEEEPEPRRHLRLVGRLGLGGSIRLVTEDELQHDRLAPAYLDLQGAVVLPTRGVLRHSALLGVSTNLGADGSFRTGPDPFEQWVFTAGYGLHLGFGDPAVPTWLVGGHAGIGVVASPDATWGVELGFDGAYYFLAGLGVYAEVLVSTYFGAEDRFGDAMLVPLLSGEIGLTWDYEVLP